VRKEVVAIEQQKRHATTWVAQTKKTKTRKKTREQKKKKRTFTSKKIHTVWNRLCHFKSQRVIVHCFANQSIFFFRMTRVFFCFHKPLLHPFFFHSFSTPSSGTPRGLKIKLYLVRQRTKRPYRLHSRHQSLSRSTHPERQDRSDFTHHSFVTITNENKYSFVYSSNIAALWA
jgi:hypothetical protein